MTTDNYIQFCHKVILALQKQKDKLRTSVIFMIVSGKLSIYLVWIGVGKLILDDRGAGVD